MAHDDKRQAITVEDIPIEQYLENQKQAKKQSDAGKDFASNAVPVGYNKPRPRYVNSEAEGHGPIRLVPKGEIMREQYGHILHGLDTNQKRVLALILTGERLTRDRIRDIIEMVTGKKIGGNSLAPIFGNMQKTPLMDNLEVIKNGQRKTFRWVGNGNVTVEDAYEMVRKVQRDAYRARQEKKTPGPIVSLAKDQEAYTDVMKDYDTLQERVIAIMLTGVPMNVERIAQMLSHYGGKDVEWQTVIDAIGAMHESPFFLHFKLKQLPPPSIELEYTWEGPLSITPKAFYMSMKEPADLGRKVPPVDEIAEMVQLEASPEPAPEQLTVAGFFDRFEIAVSIKFNRREGT